VTDEERKKAKDVKSASDVLKQKVAYADGVDMLFAAMARAAGFDARLALSGSRGELFFRPNIPILQLVLNSSSIAVKNGSSWQFYSPASRFVPFGMLSWQEEGQQALITDPKDAVWTNIPLSPADRSMEKRTGHFKLFEDGTLEGEGRIEFTGHRGIVQKVINYDDSSIEQEKRLKDLIKQNIGSAEVECFTIENVTDPTLPFVYTFKIRVPGYAARTGKRLFFQPGIFERNSKPLFVSSVRKSDIYFNYPFSEQDEITIDLPTGFSLENADSPATVNDSQRIGSEEIEMRALDNGKSLLYQRKFSFGNGGYIQFGPNNYPTLKGLFEAFNKADVHQLTLRVNAAN
jgi:hypothetical protein